MSDACSVEDFEGYITPLLMSYIDKYVKNIKPSDLKLSFWGGDVVLRNLELRLDVLEKELKYPLKFKSGCIRELTVHIPWNAIASQSVEVTIKDIEFVIKLKDVRLHSAQTEPSQQSEDGSDVDMTTQPTGQPAPADQAPGYLKGYVTRISDNVILHVQNMVVKVIEEECDMMFTMNIGSVERYTTDENWEKKFIYTDYFQGDNSLYKVCQVTDLAVNLHPIEGTYEGESTKEPFIQRCSFTCRMKSDYRGSVVVKETMNVFFESVEFCVDERQFCLYFHHLEWLLAMYYTSKRLKGRDDQQQPSDSQSAATPGMPTLATLGTDTVPPIATSMSPVNGGDQSGSPAGATNPRDQQQGWGSWMWSFLGDQEAEENRQGASSEHTSSANRRRTPNHSIAIFSKSVSVTLKVTHQMQVPMFYSVRSFTKPVLHINFTGCKAQLDQDPSTKLFLISVGIMSIDASITGICPCAKKFPASWRASAASATEQVPVFSVGEEETCDHPQAILQGSLFDAPAAGSLSSDVDLSRSSSPSEAFKAVWFTYEYYDVSPSRQIEECTGTLNIGRVKAAISPDVIHRLQHFYEAFLQSQEANPKFSEGMVVIGDQTAETIFRIKLAGGETILTPNVHYLPTVKLGHRPTKPQKPSSSKTKPPKLPGLCATLSESSVHMVQPMYGGNASDEVPQRYQLHAKFCEIQLGPVTFRTLEGSLKKTSLEMFLQIPSLEASKHSKTHGQNESENAYLQLDVPEMSSTLSIADVSKLLFISGSWKADPATSSTQVKFNSPPTLHPNVGKLQISVKNAIVTKSMSEHFSLLSVVLGECSGAIVEYSNADEKLCQVSPFFKGPYDTQRWNKVNSYKQSGLKKQNSFYADERLIEFFMATPHNNCEENYFPAVQTTVSGFVVCLSPLLLTYVRQLPLGVFSTPQQQTSYEPAKSEIVTRELPPGGISTVSPSTSHSPTASMVVTTEQGPQSKEDSFIQLLKLYAAKVNIGSILIVMPTQQFDEALMTSATNLDHPLDLNILPALAASVSDPHSPALTAVLLSLPDIKLASAKSHVLDEPVPREGKRDTLPWDCSLSQLSLFTVANCKALYVIEPTAVKATLAAQQEGVGITVHTEKIAVALSQKQISLLSHVVSTIEDNLLALYSSAEEKENGNSKLQLPQTPIHPPSHHSSPTYSTVTPSTLPVSSESTATSLVVYPGLSSLWIQVLVSKLAFHIYLKEPKEAWSKGEVSSSVSSSYATPITSPTSVSDADGHSVSSQGNVITKLSLEIDSASLQVDIQEKCMNVVFKVAIAEGSYLKWEQGVWVPCLSSEKLFSSSRSAIPDDLSLVIADFVPAITVQIPTSPFHQSPTKQHRNFIFLDVKIPFDQPHKSPKIHLNMLPFEVVAWLPLAHYLHSLVAAATQEKPAATVKSQSKAGLTTDVASWPAVEISLECFRVVLPTQDYSSTLLLSVGGLQATSSVNYASPDVRYIVNSSLYRRLSLLSSEKKQPPLPVYQLDAYSISLWGLTRNNVIGSPKAHLYASSANLRVVYTPPLYWIPHPGNVTTPLYKSESANLACGHCVEANLTTDLNVVLGIEQIACVSDILASNVFTSSLLTQREDEPLKSKVLVQSTESSTPFKLLLTGGVIAVSMLTDSDATCGDFTINQSDLSFEYIAQPGGIITPLLQASVYNPLCSIQSNESSIKCEISCFNAAVCYSDTPTSVSYADLLDGQTVPTLLSNQLLETHNGQPQGKNDLPASFLNLNWSSVHKNRHPDAVAALSLDIGRPTKLTFTPALIQEALKVLQCMSKVNRLDNDKSRDERESDPRDLHDTDTSQQTMGQSRRSTSNLELKFTTTQVLVELQLPVPEKAHLLEVDASLQGEGSAPAMTTTEGFLLVWDNLTVAYPHQEISQGSTRLTGDLHVSGLQLLVVADGQSSPVVLPMQLSCLFSQHLPSSTLDLPQVEVSFSCGLVQFNVSQTTAQLAMKTIKVMSDVATSLNVESGEEEPTRSKTGPNVETTVVQFTDDLRTGEFKYITENMDRPRTPDLGEIVFHLGNQDTVATMAWHYQEPRAITNVKVLPVPFSITTEEDVPVDIKVVCGLEYWSDELNSYVSLVSFHVSEATVTEVLLPPEQQIPSRRWRVCVNDVEWVDEEEGELLISKASVSDNSGSQVPLSSILSPLSLAASTQIDSYFSSSFIPLYTVNVHFQDIQATLLHNTNTKCTSGHYFRGYPIIHNSYDAAPQELLRMDISSFSAHLRQTRNSSTSLKLDGLVSVHFVDFRDLTWRTTIHPTNVNTSIEAQKTKEAAHWSARSDTNSLLELTVAVKCSPAVVRVSQGLVHTTILAAHAWSSSVGDNITSKETSSFTIFNQFILCNDTLEDLHIGQVSTDEILLLPSNACIGYSWRSHKTSPPQALHACLVTDGVWRWTKPFDISTTSVQEIQLFVGINTATLYVHVTDLGGLQKQVTLCGSWKLCTSLPFALEAQLVFTQHIDKPWTQKQELHKNQPQRLSLTPGTSVPSIIAADNELAGVQVRVSGVKDGWSIVYPLNSTAHDWNKPQLLAEVSTNSSETIHCWYNIKPMDSTDGRPWGNKITFAPLFAVCNHFPFDLILNIVATNAGGHSSSLPSCVVPSRGMNLPLTNLSADTWYHLKFRISESTAISEPAVALSTYLLLQLPFSPHKSTDKEWPYDTPSGETQDSPPDTDIVATAACKLTLPLEGGYYCSMNATILRSTLNTVTVHLKPETLVVNRCPLTVRLVEAMNEEDEEESRERIADLDPMDVAILVQRKFTLCLPWKDQQLLSEPVMLPTRKGEKSKDGKDKDHPTPLKVVLCNNKSSTNQVIGELLITFNWYDDMLVATVKPNYIVYNNTSHQLSLWPCVMVNQLQSELSYVTATCLQQIAPGESKEVVFWHGEGVPTGGTTHALSLRESGKEAEETEWSIFISPNYVRYSFALPTSNSQEPFLPCVITTHEHESVTYIVIVHDPSPRLQIQNLCGAMVEVVASETNGVDAFPQSIPPGHQVTYEVPTLAKLYPAVYDEDIASDFEKQLQKTSKQVSLSFRVCRTHGEDENEGNLYTWSSPFPLTSDKDEVIDIPGMGSILVSTHRQGNTMSISLLPTGMVSSFQPVGKGATTLLGERKPLTFDGTITEFVLCLDDEASDPLMTNEVLRILGNDAELHYSSSAEDGTLINLAIRLLQVDNMSESSLGEFSVTVIPRAEHVVAAELIKSEPLPLVRFTVHYNPHIANLIDTFHVSFQPVTLQLEDSLLLKCKSLLQSYGLPGVLETESFTRSTTKLLVVPPSVLQEAERDASPLIISSLVIEPTSFYLNAKISLKVLLSCNDSSFQFSRYELRNVYSNFSEVSQTISAHYVSMIIMQIGWLLGSLELIGSPGTFIQSVGRGLRDLVKLPYEGLTRSPSLFIVGIGQGAASFFRQFSSGALGSVTNLASSISRNMERLSMDPHHVSFQERQRRERPATHFTSGLVTGISSFSLSLMSAVAGIVEQPMQSVHQMEASPTAFGATKSLLAGMGKGLIGAVAKPVGGAMELVSQTGQGLLHGTGLTQKLIHKAIELECYIGPIHRSNLPTTTTRCAGKLEATECLLAAVPVIQVSSNGAKNSAILLLTHTRIHLLDCESDSLQQNFSIEEYNLVEKGSPQVDEVELHLLQPSQSHPQRESPKFQPIEHYLQLSQSSSHELVISPQFETLESLSEEPAEDPSVVLLVKTHKAAQLLCVYHAVRQCLVEPKSTFCIHALPTTQCHDSLLQKDSFYSCT